MKKNYIAPALNCVTVSTMNMLAESYSQTLGSEETEDSGAELGAKSSVFDSVWDD